MSHVARPGLGRALQLGVVQALSLAPATLGMFGARLLRGWAAAAALAAVTLGGRAPSTWAAALGLLAVALLSAAVFRSGLLAAALVQGRARMLGLPAVGLGEGLALGLRRGLGWWLVGGALELLGSAWAQVSLVATLAAWVISLVRGHGGVLPSAALAAAITLGLLLSWGTSLWADQALARATSEEASYSVGVFLSAPLASGSWIEAAGVALACNGVGLCLELGGAVPLSLLARGAVLGQLVSAFAAAVAWTVADHVRAQALLALQLELPVPPPSPPVAPVIPVAEIIPVAELVPAAPALSPEPGGEGGGE